MYDVDEVKKLQDITIERIVPIMDCGVNVFFQIAMDNGDNHFHNKLPLSLFFDTSICNL